MSVKATMSRWQQLVGLRIRCDEWERSSRAALADHAPGPWSVVLPLGLPAICDADSHMVASLVIGGGIGQLKGDGVQARTVRERVSASARLIAAAPDLLNACKRLTDCLNDDLSPEQCAAWDLAMSAIAKAEGREP